MRAPTTRARARTAAQLAGDGAEALVAARLAAAGWTILARQVRVGRLEIDLLGVDPGPPRELVVVEVRWRGRRDYGLAEETVGGLKMHRLRAAVGSLVAGGRLPDGTPLPGLPVRLDLVAVEPPLAAGAEVRVRHHRGVG